MDLSNIDTASETLTPLRLQQPDFAIAQDEQEQDVLTKIPHGLTAKRNRRKSFHDDYQKQSYAITPKRVPLTAPRPNVLNSRPITSNMEHTKRSLINDLQTLRGSGKENTPLTFKNLSPARVDCNNHIGTPSSPAPLRQKRRSSLIERDDGDEAIENAAKVAKLNATFEVSTEEDQFEEAEDEDEELSRIEPFAEQSDHLFELVPTQVDEIQTEALSELNPITPSRFTEPVALSPKTEQNSRVVDESALLLDTSRSPNFDDSYVAHSPLSQHNSSIADKAENDLLVDLEEDILPSPKCARISSPSKKPFFTIAQVHEIQADFKNEVSKLEDHLKAKSVAVIELNDEVNQNKNKIYQLQDEIDSLVLQNKQILKEIDLVNAENSIFKSDIAELQQNSKEQEEKVARNRLVVTKFKERVAELMKQIDSKNGDISRLQEDILSKARAIELLSTRVADFEAQAQKLTSSLREKSARLDEANGREAKLSNDIGNLMNTLNKFENEKDELQAQIEDLKTKLHESEEKNNFFGEQLSVEENQLKEFEQQISQLNETISKQQEEYHSLNSATQEEQAQNLRKIEGYEIALAQSSKENNLKSSIIDGLAAAVNTLRSSNYRLNFELSQGSDRLRDVESDLNEANEILTVRKAEVDELNYEMKQGHTEINNLRVVIEEKNHHISQLSESLEKYNEAFTNAEAKIQQLDEDLQKQESEHLSELEQFHAEMNNVQAIVSTKSNELFKVKDEKERLQREYDLVKYELDTLKEESEGSETRISNLKAKLQEYRNHTNELEEVLKNVQEEKLQLEKETEKRLQQLAEDLYIQYSKKHEQKVQVLKKGYENKWQSKISKAESETEKLRREIEGLNAQLSKEKHEKNEIIKLWDNFKEAESNRESADN